MVIKDFIHKYKAEIFVLFIGLLFGYLLMFSTFSVENNTLLIATKAWSDFASHIPLIRSFSLGSNFPPQYPLFAGESIKYHFIFYSFVGLLERVGIRIDLALNTLSLVGFVALVFLIFLIAKEIFKSKSIGILSVIFFIFNSSLSFFYFFKKFPISVSTINQIFSNHDFLSFAPYGTGIITAFWNLNIYTNQRHLALSFALSLGIILVLIKKINGSLKIKNEKLLFTSLGIILGLSFFLHIAAFLMTSAVVASLGILFKKARAGAFLILAPAALIALPQYKYLTSSVGYQMHYLFGYLVSPNVSIDKFLQFWFFNIGLSIFLIPIGFVLSNKFQRKILLTFFSLFIIGNTIQFSPEIAANHKFFNYFIIVGNIYSAYAIYKVWQFKNYLVKVIAVVIFFFMIFGGIIDLFPILNDQKVGIPDYKIDERSLWIKNNTSPSSVFLNTQFLYDPASLAGRKIYLGWPYFAWSQGYDTDKRLSMMRSMLGEENKKIACQLLNKDKIDYVEIQIPQDSNLPEVSEVFSKDFVLVYKNTIGNYSIYNVEKSCK